MTADKVDWLDIPSGAIEGSDVLKALGAWSIVTEKTCFATYEDKSFTQEIHRELFEVKVLLHWMLWTLREEIEQESVGKKNGHKE